MKNCVRLLALLGILAVCVSAASAREAGYPDCVFINFDDVTDTYTYQVTCFTDDIYPFGRLIVKAEVGNVDPYKPWSAAGPVGDPLGAWAFSIGRWSWVPIKDKAIWTASGEQVVPAYTAWVGTFTLTVPNSQPTGGLAVTMNGGEGSMWEHTVYVPGPAAIPEPSSLLALGALAGMLPILRRRK